MLERKGGEEKRKEGQRENERRKERIKQKGGEKEGQNDKKSRVSPDLLTNPSKLDQESFGET